MEEKMNVESTVVEVVENEKLIDKGVNFVKANWKTGAKVLGGVAAVGLAVFGVSKLVSNGNNDIVEDAIEIIELSNE